MWRAEVGQEKRKKTWPEASGVTIASKWVISTKATIRQSAIAVPKHVYFVEVAISFKLSSWNQHFPSPRSEAGSGTKIFFWSQSSPRVKMQSRLRSRHTQIVDTTRRNKCAASWQQPPQRDRQGWDTGLNSSGITEATRRNWEISFL